MRILTPAEWQHARLNDPENPVNPAFAHHTDYQVNRRMFCEVCLLRGIKVSASLEVHHVFAQNILTIAVFPELVKHPHNLFTVCDTPGHDFTCHRTIGHNSHFARCNPYMFEFMYQGWCQKYGHKYIEADNLRLGRDVKYKEEMKDECNS